MRKPKLTGMYKSLDDVPNASEFLINCSKRIMVRIVWTDGRAPDVQPMLYDPTELTAAQACRQFKQVLQADVERQLPECTCGRFHGVVSVTPIEEDGS